jgi:hypothetical protein
MLNTVEGVYRDGKIELLEKPPNLKEARVIVTFLPKNGPIDLRERGIDEAEAAQMRAQFETIAEDWERPEMDVYDDL